MFVLPAEEVDGLLNDFYGERFQGCASAGTGCAEAGGRIIECPVVLADDMPAVTSEEFAVAIVEGKWKVTAKVFVGDDLAFVPGEKGVALDPLLDKSEAEGARALEFLDRDEGAAFGSGVAHIQVNSERSRCQSLPSVTRTALRSCL